MNELIHPNRRSTDDPAKSVRWALAFFVASSFVILAVMIVIVTVTLWSIYPYHTVSLRDGGTLEVKPNEVVLSNTEINIVHLSGEYCKETDSPLVKVKRTLMGEFTSPNIPSIQATPFIDGVGCATLSEDVVIPKVLNGGKYFIRTDYTFKVNPIKEKTTTIDSGIFVITPTPGPVQRVIPQ